MANPPEDHHYIPKFMLRSWSDQNGRIFRYLPVHNGRLVRKQVYHSQVGFEKDLYTIQGMEDPWKAAALEHSFFSPLDNHAALAYQSLMQTGHATTNELRSGWAAFLSSLLIRSPHDLEATVEEFDKIIQEDPEGIETTYQSLKKPEDPENLIEWIKKRDPNFKRKSTLISIQKVILDFNRNNYLVKIGWSVIDVSDSKFKLLISDAPIVLRPLKLENGHIVLPISPNRLFLASEFGEFHRDTAKADPTKLVEVVNQQVVGCARFFVCSQCNSQERFIRNRFGAMNRSTVGVREQQ